MFPLSSSTIETRRRGAKFSFKLRKAKNFKQKKKKIVKMRNQPKYNVAQLFIELKSTSEKT